MLGTLFITLYLGVNFWGSDLCEYNCVRKQGMFVLANDTTT
jgi:hypothetical protein